MKITNNNQDRISMRSTRGNSRAPLSLLAEACTALVAPRRQRSTACPDGSPAFHPRMSSSDTYPASLCRLTDMATQLGGRSRKERIRGALGNGMFTPITEKLRPMQV